MKSKTTYTFDHEDVIQLVIDHIAVKYGVDVRPDQLYLRVREGRIDEGYGGYSGDIKARIQEISFEVEHD